MCRTGFWTGCMSFLLSWQIDLVLFQVKRSEGERWHMVMSGCDKKLWQITTFLCYKSWNELVGSFKHWKQIVTLQFTIRWKIKHFSFVRTKFNMFMFKFHMWDYCWIWLTQNHNSYSISVVHLDKQNQSNILFMEMWALNPRNAFCVETSHSHF